MTAIDLPAGDPSGSDTFGRYRYQAKLTLFFWLTTLAHTGPNAVYAEHVEDILLQYEGRLAFIQVKTRATSAGTWTADVLCSAGGGIDSLCRAYAVARNVTCSFSLHLEGSVSMSEATLGFVKDCSSASKTLRTKIAEHLKIALGCDQLDTELDDFLSRLRVVPNQPSQRDIDGKCFRALCRLVPQLPGGDVEILYGRLLQIVEDAQQAQSAALGSSADGVVFLQAQLSHLMDATYPPSAVVTDKRLTRERLLEFLPAVSEPTALLLIERTLDGRSVTALEEKLTAAGAGSTVVMDARLLRALTEPRRLELLSGPDVQAGQLSDVSNRVLVHARAVAQLCKAGAEPANDLWARLVAETGLEQTDQARLFNGDRLSLLGLLCCLSDECKFPWTAP